jgi:hypothetical protein
LTFAWRFCTFDLGSVASIKKGTEVQSVPANSIIPGGIKCVNKKYNIRTFLSIREISGEWRHTNMTNSHHVVPNPNGGWDVKKGGAEKASLHTDTKQDAIDRGREISKNQGTEFVIHGQNGVIQSKDSHGNDPREVKG